MIYPLFQIGLDRARNIKLVLVTACNDLDGRRRVAVESTPTVGLGKAIVDACNIVERQSSAVGIGAQHELSEFAARVYLPLRAQQYVTALRPDRATGQIDRRVPDRLGDLAHGQPVFPQGLLRDFNTDLVRTIAERDQLVDLRQF